MLLPVQDNCSQAPPSFIDPYTWHKGDDTPPTTSHRDSYQDQKVDDSHVIYFDEKIKSSSCSSKKKLSVIPQDFHPTSKEELKSYNVNCLKEYAKQQDLLEENKKYKKEELEQLVWEYKKNKLIN
jgi:hypothetical protein